MIKLKVNIRVFRWHILKATFNKQPNPPECQDGVIYFIQIIFNNSDDNSSIMRILSEGWITDMSTRLVINIY